MKTGKSIVLRTPAMRFICLHGPPAKWFVRFIFASSVQTLSGKFPVALDQITVKQPNAVLTLFFCMFSE